MDDACICYRCKVQFFVGSHLFQIQLISDSFRNLLFSAYKHDTCRLCDTLNLLSAKKKKSKFGLSRFEPKAKLMDWIGQTQSSTEAIHNNIHINLQTYELLLYFFLVYKNHAKRLVCLTLSSLPEQKNQFVSLDQQLGKLT